MGVAYKDKKIVGSALPSDTVLFKFVFGQTKEEVDNRINYLVKEGSIKPYTTKILTMSHGGFESKFKEEGYPCVLYFGGDSIPALMSFNFYNDSLMAQRFYMYNKSPSFFKLDELYGSDYETDYPTESKAENTTFRSVGDKAIFIVNYARHYTMNIEKMSTKLRFTQQQITEQQIQDSIEKANISIKSSEQGW